MRRARGPRPDRHEFTIDELARASSTTVRNVRAYQERGLLPPPDRRGRTGFYDGTHLARLRIIGQLLERGYSLGNIGELITAWERGHDLRELLGLESAIAAPWSDEIPVVLTLAELVPLFGGSAEPAALAEAVDLGILELADGGRFRVPSPRMLHAGAELVRAGVPLERMLDIVRGMRANVTRVAEDLVRLVVEYVFDPHGKDRLPPTREVPRLAAVVRRLRPVAEMAINAEASRALERAVRRQLGDRLEAILAHLPPRASSQLLAKGSAKTGKRKIARP